MFCGNEEEWQVIEYLTAAQIPADPPPRAGKKGGGQVGQLKGGVGLREPHHASRDIFNFTFLQPPDR